MYANGTGVEDDMIRGMFSQYGSPSLVPHDFSNAPRQPLVPTFASTESRKNRQQGRNRRYQRKQKDIRCSSKYYLIWTIN